MRGLALAVTEREYDEYRDVFTNHAQRLFDVGYLEELLFQIDEHKDRLDPSRYKGLHKKLDAAVLEILLRVKENYDAMKRDRK